MRIVHISDLHFGEELIREKVEKAVRQINEIEPDLLVITGDLSCWGIHSEMRDAYETLLDLKPDYIAVPGNHDARNIGYEFFQLYFGETKKYWKNDVVSLIAADSTQPDLDDGYIGKEQRDWIVSKIRKDRFNILALHHHIAPIPKTGRERNVLIDAGEMVELLIANGISAVLAGHRHMPYSLRLMRTHVIHAGTLGSFKVLGMPDHNYNVIEIKDNTLTLKLRFVDYGEVEIGRYTINPETPESISVYQRIAKPKKVLFLSRSNDCRTKIAEAIFNHISPNNMLAVSAGIEPAQDLDLRAVATMRELGLKINGKPRKFSEDMVSDFDAIVEFDELGVGEFWDVKKPSSAEEYREVRSEIWRRVEELVKRLLA
ncbi:metallophosphoesterase [Archaeoglobus fulgidus]|jgi:protein-tyrosine-phosphatase/predicted phosphodiesterase|uniref:LacZ expression regulatory protein (Icc) n=2 Tax=Archaeoglobus fulgidus TaxID=2234 RepID=O30241_ARCFU|nr:metallophosphoesterase [Archaeoglobus fulgidus]AAB91233.1 lacZ expression regulatory protein (icc) [Archaeoglobus fulgidus DSM 4304]AIG99397.1 putative phosphohydrolase [Archaeoglobus fulgidus DSM 8774]